MAELTQAMTPDAVVKALASQGIVISERTLRMKARRTGACRVIGRAIFFMPDDLERFLEAMRPEMQVAARPPGRRSRTLKPSDGLEEARAKLKALKKRAR